MSHRYKVRLLGAVVASVITLAAHAQTGDRPFSRPTSADGEIIVSGNRMPGAEAPRSATCEALVRDPTFRAQLEAGGGHPLMGPRPYLPTRAPRNPDYGAPPLSPPGSALPILPQVRFGVSRTAPEGLGESAALRSEGESGLGDEAAAMPEGLTSAQAIDLCRAYQTTGGGAGRGRAEIARRDTSLPMAFALFDQRRFAESLDWFRKAANKLPMADGGDEAALFIGKLMLQGLGAESDPAEAIKWLKRVADARFNPVTQTPVFDPRAPERNTAMGEAAVILGNLHRSGFGGIAKDPAKARKYYERAYEVGHVPAAKTLGDIHHLAIDTPRDAEQALSWYRKAARLGHAPAQYALAEILYLGDDGVKRDLKAALGWYQAAARLDHPGALYALGRAYEGGEGVAADAERALGFYKSAVLHGSPAAKMVIGTHFYEGRLLPRDHALARRWFEEAAAEWDVEAMYNLSAMLARGEGGPRDAPRAWALMTSAATRGHALAQRTIGELEQRMTASEKQAAATLLAAAAR